MSAYLVYKERREIEVRRKRNKKFGEMEKGLEKMELR